MKYRTRRLREAFIMSDSGDTRSYNDIYGDEGLQTEDASSSDVVQQLTPEQIGQLRDLASQILTIVGPSSSTQEDDDDGDVTDDGDFDNAGLLEESTSRKRTGYYLN